jgi:hypothetical protein
VVFKNEDEATPWGAYEGAIVSCLALIESGRMLEAKALDHRRVESRSPRRDRRALEIDVRPKTVAISVCCGYEDAP